MDICISWFSSSETWFSACISVLADVPFLVFLFAMGGIVFGAIRRISYTVNDVEYWRIKTIINIVSILIEYRKNIFYLEGKEKDFAERLRRLQEEIQDVKEKNIELNSNIFVWLSVLKHWIITVCISV